MADSPLELYEKAYRLQYEKKAFAEAAEVYNRIIRDFPESNECGYSVIQLEKLKANNILSSQERPSGQPTAAALVSLSLNALAVIMLIIACVAYLIMRNADRQYVAMLSQAIGSMAGGSNDAALKTLSELKFKTAGDITPYALSAAIFARLGKYNEALAEIEKFKKVYPSRQVPPELYAAIEQQRSSSSKALPQRMASPAPVDEEIAIPVEEPENITKIEPPKKPEPLRPAFRAAKPKSPAKSSRDTVSFF